MSMLGWVIGFDIIEFVQESGFEYSFLVMAPAVPPTMAAMTATVAAAMIMAAPMIAVVVIMTPAVVIMASAPSIVVA